MHHRVSRILVIRCAQPSADGLTLAFTLGINHERRLIEFRYGATVTDRDLLEAEIRLRNTAELDRGYRLLHDFSWVADFRVTGAGLYELSARTQDITSRTAIVVQRGFIEGMAITYEGMANWKALRVQVFTNEAEALEWLAREG
jgi:hypothetical protein